MNECVYLPYNAHAPLLSRIKVLGNMDIGDHRPQDGQFSVKAEDKEVDVRVATISTAYGEMATLRLLDKSFALRKLDDLGFSPENLSEYERMLKSPFGMLLVSGPTGSGKTTTLYASINSLDRKAKNIITVEDPIEYHLNGINQIQVNPRAKLTFSAGLRSIMRHDPDVILVGEIRDSDTAAIAIQAANTGHLVLASVHANDTVGVLLRLIDLGIEPFLVATALVGIVAQRMVRRVCPYCQHEVEAPTLEQQTYYAELGEEKKHFVYGAGCNRCSNSGYLGRIAVFEILCMNDDISRLVSSGAGTQQIRDKSKEKGLSSMWHDGMLKAKAGITTPSEVIHNLFSLG
jgi:general secretion pathway protein E